MLNIKKTIGTPNGAAYSPVKYILVHRIFVNIKILMSMCKIYFARYYPDPARRK